MPQNLDSSVGGELANSYCSLTWADDYWENHYDAIKVAVWAALSDEAKTELLISACSVIESINFTDYSFRFDSSAPHGVLEQRGSKLVLIPYNIWQSQITPYYWNQQLQFPRSIDQMAAGTIYIPEDVLRAQCYQAVYLATIDETVLIKQGQGITNEHIILNRSQIEIEQEYGNPGLPLAPMAKVILSKYMRKHSARMTRA